MKIIAETKMSAWEQN